MMTRGTTRFYLFLDVDGVLHPAPAGAGPDLRIHHQLDDGLPLSRLPVFEKTIRPHLQQIAIVISSSWRLHPPSLEGLLDSMSDDVRDRVVGVTPDYRKHRDEKRSNEIIWWLKKYSTPGDKAIVLDDHPPPVAWMHFERFGTWIQVDPVRAFGDREVEWLTRILAEQE